MLHMKVYILGSISKNTIIPGADSVRGWGVDPNYR